MSARFQRIAPAIAENPFRILGLTAKATAREVEREGGRILALIAAGLDSTSAGELTPPPNRTAEQVRWAMSELRDPGRRAVHEFFWLAGDPLPVEPQRVEALLEKAETELLAPPTVERLLQQHVRELIPTPPAWRGSEEDELRFEAVLAPPPRPSAPRLCFDSLDVEEMLELSLPGASA